MTVACSHQRSYEYFTESILSSCKFTAVPCTTADDFQAGHCMGCGAGPCPSMGYDADKSTRTGTFYLKTNGQSPFCSKSIFNYLITSVQKSYTKKSKNSINDCRNT